MNNDIPILGGEPTLSTDQMDVIEVLGEALQQAKEGNIDAVAIIACMKGGYAPVMAGKRAGDLMLGTVRLQRMIDEATQNGAQTQAISRIVKARRL